MKHISLTIALITMGFSTQAQSTTRTEEYSEFTLAAALGSGGRYSVRLDTGQLVSVWPDKLRDENRDIVLFNSAIDALNYLNSFGWELFDIRNNSNGNYYVMRRKVNQAAADPTKSTQNRR